MLRVLVCYVRSNICYRDKNYILNKMENIFTKVLLRNTKQKTIGIIYKPLNQLKFLETSSDSLNKPNIINEE